MMENERACEGRLLITMSHSNVINQHDLMKREMNLLFAAQNPAGVRMAWRRLRSFCLSLSRVRNARRGETGTAGDRESDRGDAGRAFGFEVRRFILS